MADALCNCRFESTYTTTEETVYQNLLDVILNCIRCDAGVSLTKRRAWTIIETVYNMAFKWSVTPVCVVAIAHMQLLQKSAVNTLTHIILTLFSRLRHPEDFCCEPPPEKLVSSPPSFVSAPFRLSPSGASVAEAGGAEAGSVETSGNGAGDGVANALSENATEAVNTDSSHVVNSSSSDSNGTDHENNKENNKENSNDTNNDNNNTNNPTETEVTGDLGEKDAADDASETEEESVGESDDALVPYDITLLQQLLGYLISLTDPSKSVCGRPLT